MSGYREHGFDPNAYEQEGAPLRPYNWVQWSGVTLATVGVVVSTLHIAGRIGWIPQWVEDSSPWSLILLILGVVLINSRRQPGTMVGSEQLARNRRVLLVTAVICAIVLGAAAIIDLQGA